uniref:trypsin-like serine peptidase n=1 Tax=Cupriavidus yeoncheonensis TaxID=1462994 RepID=UPI003F4943FC
MEAKSVAATHHPFSRWWAGFRGIFCVAILMQAVPSAYGETGTRQWTDDKGCAELSTVDLGRANGVLNWSGECEGDLRHGIGQLTVVGVERVVEIWTGAYRHGARIGHWGMESDRLKEQYFYPGGGQPAISRSIFNKATQDQTFEIRENDRYVSQPIKRYRVSRDTPLMQNPDNRSNPFQILRKNTFVITAASTSADRDYLRVLGTNQWPTPGYVKAADLQRPPDERDGTAMRQDFNALLPVPSVYQSLGYPDSRRFVRDAIFPPFTSMARLRIRRGDGTVSICSAAFAYALNVLVTAAHCVAADESKGLSGVAQITAEIVGDAGVPLEKIEGSVFAIGNRSEEGISARKEDWAVIRLAHPPRSPAVTPLRFIDDAMYYDTYRRDVMKLGFPADVAGSRLVASLCSSDVSGMHVQFMTYPPGRSPRGYFAIELRLACLTFPGDSGGPVLWFDSKDGTYAIAGIVSAISPANVRLGDDGKLVYSFPEHVRKVRAQQSRISRDFRMGDAVFISDGILAQERAVFSSNMINAVSRAIGLELESPQHKWKEISEDYRKTMSHDNREIRIRLMGLVRIADYIGENVAMHSDAAIFSPEMQGGLVKGERLPAWSSAGDVMSIPVNVFEGDVVTGGDKVNINAYLVGGSLVIADIDTGTIVGVSRDFLAQCILSKPICPHLE